MPNSPQYELFNDNQTSNKEDEQTEGPLWFVLSNTNLLLPCSKFRWIMVLFQSGICGGPALAGFCHSSQGWGGGAQRRWKKPVGQDKVIYFLLKAKGAVLWSVWIWLPCPPSALWRGKMLERALGAGLRALVCYQHTALGAGMAELTLFPPEPAQFPCYRCRKCVGEV